MKIKEKRQYLNENFFESIDSEIKAYLLGFLFADGYVNIRRNNTSYRFGVEVSEKDNGILYLFIQYIYPYSNIYIRNPRMRKGFMCAKQNYIEISSFKLVKDLIKNGCIENKSKKQLSIPKMEYPLIKHFIRGYFDGDGCAYIRNNTVEFSITSKTNNLLDEFKNYFNENGIEIHLNHQKTENKYILKTTNKDFTSKIYNLLYNDANFYFKRKFQKMNIVKQYRDKSYNNIYGHRNA